MAIKHQKECQGYTKECQECGERPLEDFLWLKARSNHRHLCRKCYNVKQKQYLDKNPDQRHKYSVMKKANKVKRSNNRPSWANINKMAQIEKEVKKLQTINGEPYHYGHIFPLGGKLVSGLDIASNARPQKAHENLSANNGFNPCRASFDSDGNLTYYELLFNGVWIEVPTPTWTDISPKNLFEPYTI